MQTITIEIQENEIEALREFARIFIDAFADWNSARREQSKEGEGQRCSRFSEMPDDEAAVLWYAMEIEKAERAYDEHMKALCTAASHAKGPDDFRKVMEEFSIDKYTFLGHRLHQSIARAHYPWISIEDLKPSDVGMDWVQVQPLLLPECCWGVPETAEMRDGKWYTMDDTLLEENETVIVTHWRPLPASPKEKPYAK